MVTRVWKWIAALVVWSPKKDERQREWRARHRAKVRAQNARFRAELRRVRGR